MDDTDIQICLKDDNTTEDANVKQSTYIETDSEAQIEASNSSLEAEATSEVKIEQVHHQAPGQMPESGDKLRMMRIGRKRKEMPLIAGPSKRARRTQAVIDYYVGKLSNVCRFGRKKTTRNRRQRQCGN